MEEWKGLIYRGENLSGKYEISNQGRLRNSISKKIYKTFITKKGYEQVKLSLSERKIGIVLRIHVAVAENFIENKFNKQQVNHIDCNKLNNKVENLEWVTQKENMEHAAKNNLVRNGTEHRFTKEEIVYIRTNYKYRDIKNNTYALAHKFGVHQKTIFDILKFKRYKWC